MIIVLIIINHNDNDINDNNSFNNKLYDLIRVTHYDKFNSYPHIFLFPPVKLKKKNNNNINENYDKKCYLKNC